MQKIAMRAATTKQLTVVATAIIVLWCSGFSFSIKSMRGSSQRSPLHETSQLEKSGR